MSGGKGARSTWYAESCVSRPHDKGNRNEIEGKQFAGEHDTFIADGGTATL